jgi:hypothetical protein
MTKEYFDAINDTALLAYINRLESENEELRLATENKVKKISTPHETRAIEELDKIRELCVLEADLINTAFGVSEKLGIATLMNSTQSFESFLRGIDKMFVAGMSIEYRIFVIDILMLIDEQYRGIATAKLLMN